MKLKEICKEVIYVIAPPKPGYYAGELLNQSFLEAGNVIGSLPDGLISPNRILARAFPNAKELTIYISKMKEKQIETIEDK